MTDISTAPAPAPKGMLSGQVSRAMLWNATLQPLRLLAGLASGIVLSHGIAKDAYGTTAMISAMAGTLGLIVDFGVERGLVKFLPEIEARHGRAGVQRVLRLVIAQKLAILVFVVALAVAFHQRFFDYWRGKVHEPPMRATLDAHQWLFFGALMGLIIFGAVFDVYMQVLTSYFRQRASGAIGVVTTILKPLLVIGVVVVGWDVLGVLGVMIFIPAVATMLAGWQAAHVRRTLDERPTREPGDARLKSRFLAYCGLSYWIQLTEYAYSLDFIILLLPNAAVIAGFKFVHSIVTQLLTALWSPLSGVQIPLFARLHVHGEDRQLGDAYAILSKFLAATMIPAAVGLTLLSYNLLAIINGRYADFATVARILTIGLCLDAAISVPLAILMAYERYRPMLIARSGALIAVPIILVVAPRYGAVGAALVMSGARLACDGLAMALALRELPIRYPVAFAGRVVGAATAMALVVAPLALTVLAPPIDMHLSLRIGYLLGNLALAGIGALVFLGVFRLTGGLDPADRRRIADLRIPVASAILRFL